MKPFEQLHWRDVPAAPRIPHPYFELDVLEPVVTSVGFGSLRAHVRVAGSGPPLVLVHGLMTAGYSWRYVVDALAEDYTVYIPDFPGSGRSESPTNGSFSPASMAAWLSALLDELGIRGARVIGNSMGGYLCMVLALQDPGAMSKLVNLHSPGFPEARLYALRTVMRMPGALRLLRKLVHSNPRRWVQRNVHYYDESLKSVEELDEYAMPLLTDGGLRAFAGNLAETMDPLPMRRFVAELRARRDAGVAFPVRLQLVFTKQDPVVPPQFGPRFQRLVPGSELVVLEEGSYFAHVDAPEMFLEAVRPFLS